MDKRIINNKYIRFGISCFNLLYLILICVLTMWTFLYKISFTNEKAFIGIYIVLNSIFLVLMILTRDQIITRFISTIMLLPVFVLMLFNLDNLWMFIPPIAVGVLMFFICTAGDTVKVIMGSMYLLLFVVGLVGYMILTTLFGGSAIETVLSSDITDPEVVSAYDMNKISLLNANNVSPDGQYRYYILDVQDNDRGKVIIVVEPNYLDVNYRFFKLIEEGYTSRIAKYSVRGVTPDIEWVLNDEYGDGAVKTDADGNEVKIAKYKLRYRFGEGSEWKTSTINIPKKKNYLKFMNLN